VKEKIYIINGNPIPLARPRMGQGHVYDSQKKEKLIYGLDLRNQHGHEDIHEGPIHVAITFFMKMPSNLSQSNKRELIGRYHFIRPDIDNLVKMILDCGNGVLWKDDAIIASLSAHKVYSAKPHTKIVVIQLDETSNCLC
jgi:Holliday junction resolvase RusA-like endonuclease